MNVPVLFRAAAASALLAAALPASAGDESAAAQQAPQAVPAAPGLVPGAPSAPAASRWSFGVWGVLPTSANIPTAINAQGSAQATGWDQAWGFGLAVEYRVSPEVRVFADGGIYQQEKLVAREGEYGSSFWVYEQTGYTTHDIGPFPEDAYYYTDTSAIRLGAKYVLPLGGFSPWVGATFGVYSWTATYGNEDRSGKWGQDTGLVTGFTFLAGADLALGDRASIGLFADLASPVARVEMEDLFQDGWTWTAEANQHVVAPYRFGLLLSYSL